MDPKRVLVDIEVEARIPLTKGTYAQLGMEGITGVAYVHLLDDGKDGAPLPKAAGRGSCFCHAILRVVASKATSKP